LAEVVLSDSSGKFEWHNINEISLYKVLGPILDKANKVNKEDSK